MSANISRHMDLLFQLIEAEDILANEEKTSMDNVAGNDDVAHNDDPVGYDDAFGSDDAVCSDEFDFGELSRTSSFYFFSSGVRFAESDNINEIMGLDSFSKKEIQNYWYSPEEKQRMHDAKDEVVERIEAGLPPKKDMTYRGLECWTTKEGNEITANIAQVVDGVMDEQEAQWDRDEDDQDRIAQVSLALSVTSKLRALEIGFQDERDASQAWVAQFLSQIISEDKPGPTPAKSRQRKRQSRKKLRRSHRSKYTSSETKESEIKQRKAVPNDAVLRRMESANRKP